LNIFLVSYEVFERPAKIAMALKRVGHDVTLIHCMDTLHGVVENNTFLKSCFSRTIKIEDSSRIEELITSFNIKFVHIFSKFTDPLALYFVNRPGIKTIFDYKDVFEGLITHNYTSEVYSQQEYLIFNSDYLCNRDFQILNFEKFKGKKVSKKIYYPDLVWSNQPMINKIDQVKVVNFNRIKLVLIGNFVLERQNPEHAGNGYFYIVKSLLEQGFEVNIYPANPHTYNQQFYSDFLELANNNQNLLLHNYVSQIRLQEELFNYDFGLHLQQSLLFDNLGIGHIPEIINTSNPSRIMDYIGSGIPIIYNEEYRFIGRFNYRYGIGIPITKDDFFNLADVLKKRYCKKAKPRQIANAAYYLNSNRWINKLIKIYQKFS
jgi:hypothetical protein